MLFLGLTFNSEAVAVGVPGICYLSEILPPTAFSGSLMFVNQYGGLEVAPSELGSNYELLYLDASNVATVGVPLSPSVAQTLAIVIAGQNCVVDLIQQVIDPIQFPGTSLPFGYETSADNGYANQVFLAPYDAYAEEGYWDPLYSV